MDRTVHAEQRHGDNLAYWRVYAGKEYLGLIENITFARTNPYSGPYMVRIDPEVADRYGGMHAFRKYDRVKYKRFGNALRAISRQIGKHPPPPESQTT